MDSPLPIHSTACGRYKYEVLICTFNGEKYLAQQIESILNQTRSVDRITIRDDCSTDSTVDVAQRFANGLSMSDGVDVVVEVNETRLGFIENFARSIATSTGDLLFLCDQDDVWEPQKVDRLSRALMDDGVDLAFSDGVLIDGGGSIIPGPSVLRSYGFPLTGHYGLTDVLFRLLVRRNYINGAAVAIRGSAARAALPVPSGVPHDYWLALWCASKGRASMVPELLYRYRQHSANVIGVGTGSWIGYLRSAWRHPVRPRRRELENWVEVCRRLQDRGDFSDEDIALRKLAWMRDRFGHRSRLELAIWIVGSVLKGGYREYSVGVSFWRDLFACLRGSASDSD